MAAIGAVLAATAGDALVDEVADRDRGSDHSEQRMCMAGQVAARETLQMTVAVKHRVVFGRFDVAAAFGAGKVKHGEIPSSEKGAQISLTRKARAPVGSFCFVVVVERDLPAAAFARAADLGSDGGTNRTGDQATNNRAEHGHGNTRGDTFRQRPFLLVDHGFDSDSHGRVWPRAEYRLNYKRLSTTFICFVLFYPP